MKSMIVNISAEIQAVLNNIGTTHVSDKVDPRRLHPFGSGHNYQLEPVIEVIELFTTEKFLYDMEADRYGLDIPIVIKWLAIVNHYGIDRVYDLGFMHYFRPYVEMGLLQIFRDESCAIDRPGGKPRLVSGKSYTRTEFVDAFLCFFEKHGFRF